MDFGLLEEAPLLAYAFRREGDEFILEHVNAAARARNPVLEKLRGKPMAGLYSDQPAVIADARRCALEQVVVENELAVRRYDRTEATQYLRLRFVPAPPDHIVLFMYDLPNPDVARTAASESEARYQSLVASLPDAVLLRAADGRVLFCNDMAVELFGGRSVADLLGRVEVLGPGIRFEDEDGHPVAADELPSRRVIATGMPEVGQVLVHVAGGERRYVRVAAQPVRSATGAVTGAVATFTDVTERVKLEEQLRRASRLESIGRLAGGVAHDFNNLLAAILGSLDLIEGRASGALAADLATIRHSALRARDLTRQLLTFARKQPVKWRTVDLGALVRDVELLLRRLVGPAIRIDITTGGRALVSADPALIEQVLVNLVVNARDAMPDGGTLSIRVERRSAASSGAPHAAFAVLTVGDSGVGMDAETCRRIFEPFFTTKSHGTGLGLASSYGIVQEHGGEIDVESSVGAGTSFVVRLPALAADAALHPPTRPPPAPQRARGTVLVVDDEDAVRRTIVRLVQTLGYDVLDAGSEPEALARSCECKGPIDLLLCDLAMPGSDGRNVALALLQARPEVKIVFMSGYSPDMQELRVPDALFLQKPFSLGELEARLAEARPLDVLSGAANAAPG